uniref:Uncharacterized protein n=1 Tax=Octopus bimaculoides TaxID=37653 RepID=A0A0L8FJ89_OCTBM
MREIELVANDERNNGKKKKFDKGSYYHFYYYYYYRHHHYYDYNYANCALRLTSHNQHHRNSYAEVFVNSAKLYKLIDCCSLLVSLVFWYPTKGTATSTAAVVATSLQLPLLFILLSLQSWTVSESVNIHNKPIEFDKQEGHIVKCCCIYDNNKPEYWRLSPTSVARCPAAFDGGDLGACR